MTQQKNPNQAKKIYRSNYNIPHYEHWTISAIDCFKRGCVCQGCFYDDFFRFKPDKCKMKQVVIELVRTLGLPDESQAKAE